MGKDFDIKKLKLKKGFWKLPLITVIWNESVYYLGRIFSQNKVHYDFSTSLDEKIPLVSWTVLIYFICFLFWAVIYLYMATKEKQVARSFFSADFLAKFICLLFFLFLPTTMQRPDITGNGFFEVLMRYLYELDAADNLFPSIHCMVSWFCWIGLRDLEEVPGWCKTGTLLFAIAVCISTLTTRQHVLLDVAGGIFFAEICYAITRRIRWTK